METFEQKALDYYGEVIINKHLIHEAGFGARAIPTYVGEWRSGCGRTERRTALSFDLWTLSGTRR